MEHLIFRVKKTLNLYYLRNLKYIFIMNSALQICIYISFLAAIYVASKLID